MEQISQFIAGERSYPKIEGGTGPLVYPAAHVYIYTLLYEITDEGRDILLAQCLFGGVYLAALAVVMACYRMAKVPPYVFPMLILSKRLHSIFLLRCFNDSFAVLFLFLAIYAYQKRQYTIGSIFYSWGIGIKMSLLLSLPAFGVILFLTRGIKGALVQAGLMAQLQAVIGSPFLQVDWRGYLGRAFEFSRQFLFKWTVNWRFVGEERFLSREFAVALLIGHLSVLAVFAVKWLRPSGLSIPEILNAIIRGKEPLEHIQFAVSSRITPTYIMTTVLSANTIGILFARSLHYQFFAYLAWSTPFLLWKSGVHPVLQYGLWIAQEVAWNVYPSTKLSSIIVVVVLGWQAACAWHARQL